MSLGCVYRVVSDGSNKANGGFSMISLLIGIAIGAAGGVGAMFGVKKIKEKALR